MKSVDIQNYILPSSGGAISLCLICIQQCGLVQVVRSTGEMVDHMEMSHRGILQIPGIEKSTKSNKITNKPDNILIPHGIEFKIANREIKLKKSFTYEVDSIKSETAKSKEEKDPNFNKWTFNNAESAVKLNEAAEEQEYTSRLNDTIPTLKTYICSVCKETFSTLETLSNHVFTIHSFKCKQCEFVATKDSSLRKHILKHSIKIRTVMCSICNTAFKSKGYLSYHIGKVHGFKCDVCDFKCSIQRNLERHKLKKHVEGSILCTKCPFKTNFDVSLNNHILRKHTDKEIWLKCEECEYRAWNTRLMQTHTDKVHRGIRFQCWLCNSKFTQKTNLQGHIKTLHPHSIL